MSNPVVKSFKAIETKVLDATAGLVECAFSVTGNLDRQGDIINPGAFASAKSVSPTPAVVFSHVWDDISQVLGKTVNWDELLPGDVNLPSKLKSANAKAGDGPKFGCVKAQIKFDLDTPSGALAYTHVAHDNLKEWSFAFDIAENGAEYEDHKASPDGKYSAPVRRIKSISELFEVSLVLIGANPATSTIGWKSMLKASLKEKQPDLGAVLEQVEGYKEDPEPTEFDYRNAAKEAINGILLGPDPETPPAPVAEVEAVTPDYIWAAAAAAVIETQSPATDTVPEDNTPSDVADLLGLSPFARFEISR